MFLKLTSGSQLVKDSNKVAITCATYQNHGSSFLQRNEMYICHYIYCIRISSLINVSLVSLIFQNRHLAELMARFDWDLILEIPDCIDSSLYLSQS